MLVSYLQEKGSTVFMGELSINRKKGTTAFIAESVEERLRMNIEYLDSWHQALALHASPVNIPEALDNLGRLVDHIWYYAGDRSHDVSFTGFL